MTSAASLVYTVPQGGAKISDLAATVAAVSLPLTILSSLGLRITSDETTSGASNVVRTLDVSMVPSVLPTATAATVPAQSTGSPIESVQIANHGADVVRPPVVTFADALGTGEGAAGRAYLELSTLAVENGGSTYSASTFALVLGGLPPGNGFPGMTRYTFKKVLRVDLSNGGSGYSNKTKVAFVGGTTPRGKSATGAVRVRNGVIVGVDVTDEGVEYVTAPSIVFLDETGSGSGAAATAYMVDGQQSLFQGTMATVTLTKVEGVVTAAAIATRGERYFSVPEILIFDPEMEGSGAVVTATMRVGSVELSSGGAGYQQPTVEFVPYFKAIFPDGSDQRQPLYNLMTASISRACATPVVASAPVLS